MIERIPPHFLAAHFHAGTAVLALEHGVGVVRLGLRVVNGCRERPRLTSIDEYLKACQTGKSRGQAYFDYATALIGGQVGRLLGLERFLGYSPKCFERALLVRALRADALACFEREPDRVYALAAAWLPQIDGGNPAATLERIWRRASLALRHPPASDLFRRTADELMRRGELEEPALRELLG